ncbi:hypothetical protein KSF_086830 [Reticulibacter mediterranei]|uniref:Helicase HerA central domain-containing protein n=1 Tax=Reticulibacter mediterranei TaxID=2778369 RepID=A0A8J3N7M5_9CHLR|nr:PrgI family protein [Reticulibacter mediterranei]GHO98635.1 hypothetical protein KSF_086830 [Reticulibacter mediterranei]
MHEALRRHTHPTHLFLPDKVLFGLTVRQILFLLVGGTLAYWLWLRLGLVIPASWRSVGVGVRIVAALLPFVLCLVAAFASIASRPLELWGMVALQFAAQPKRAVWRAAHQTTGRSSSRSASVQSLLPIRRVLHDLVEVGTAHARAPEQYAAIIEVQTVNVSLLSPEEQQTLFTGFRAFLSALRFPVQILMSSRRIDLSSYVRRVREAIGESPSSGEETTTDPRGQPLPSRHRLARAHLEALATLEREQLLLERRLYLIVCSEREESRWPLARIFPASKRASHTELAQVRRALDLRVASLLDQLSEMGLEGIRLVGEDLLTLLDHSLRGDSARRTPLTLAHLVHPLPGAISPLSHTEQALSEEALLSVPPQEEEDEAEEEQDEEEMDLSTPSALDQLVPSVLLISSDHLRVGENYLAGSAVVGLPREVSDGVLLPLLALDEQMEVSLHVRPLATPNVLRRLMREQAQYRSTERITKQRGMLSDPDLSVARDDTEWLIPQLASGQERLLEVGMTIMARAASEVAVHASQQRIESTLHNGLLSAHPTTLEQFEAYGTTLPLGRANPSRPFTTTSSALSALLPFTSTTMMQPSGVFVGLTSSSEPVLLDPWGADMNNPHEFWGGISGSGKSFAIKVRIMHELLIRPDLQVVVIDPAGEYRAMIEAMGGDCIRIAPGSAQSINPFDLVPAGLDLSHYVQQQQGDRLAEKIQNLHNFLDILLATNAPSTPGIDLSEERGLLDDVLYEVYARAGVTTDPWTHGRPAPLLHDVAQVLRTHKKDKHALRLAQRLQRFLTGSLAGLFSRPTNVALTAPVLAFDLREVREGSELQPAGIFLISDFLWTQALSQRRPRRLYIDEAWSLIKYQEGGEFLERMAREMRKYYMSVVTITQNPEQFIMDAHGSVIAQNAFTKVLKRLDSIGAEAASAAFGLTPVEKQRLTRLERKKALLLVGSKRLIVEITANAEEYDLAHTDPPTHVEVLALPAAEKAVPGERGDALQESKEEDRPSVARTSKRAARSGSRHASPPPVVAASSQEAELQVQAGDQQADEVVPIDSDAQEKQLPLSAPVLREQEEPLSGATNTVSLHGKRTARTRSRHAKTGVARAAPVPALRAQADQHASNGQAITATTPGGAQ